MPSVRMVILATAIAIAIAILLSGCAYYSHDKEAYLDPMNLRMCEFESTRVITLFKQFDVVIDPNSVQYKSEVKDFQVVAPPYIMGGTK